MHLIINGRYLFLFLLFVIFGCEEPRGESVEIESYSTVEQPFNAEDAITAFNSFNEYFYDTDANLYYSTTEKKA